METIRNNNAMIPKRRTGRKLQESYSPVSFPRTSKAIEKINLKIMKELGGGQRIILNEQCGLQKGYTSENQMFKMIEDTMRNTDKKRTTCKVRYNVGSGRMIY